MNPIRVIAIAVLLLAAATEAAERGAPVPLTQHPREMASDVQPPPAGRQAKPMADSEATSRVYTLGEMVIVELAEDAFIPANLLDLEGSTLDFAPDGEGGFTVGRSALAWDADLGSQINAADAGYPSTQVQINNFQFPFSGQSWASFHANAHGTISFGGDQRDMNIPRFLEFASYGPQLNGGIPVIAALFRKLGGHFGFRYDLDDVNSIFVKQRASFVLVTWRISQPYGDLQNFTDQPLLNEFQVRLNSDGSVRISYLKLLAEDGIVGIFTDPGEDCGAVADLATIVDSEDPGLAAHLDITELRVQAVGHCRLRFRYTMRGDLPPASETLSELLFSVYIDLDTPLLTGVDFADADLRVGVTVDDSFEYAGFGPGFVGQPTISGKQVTFDVFTSVLEGASPIAIFADSVDFDAAPPNFDQTSATSALDVTETPQIQQVDLSQSNGSGPHSPSVYEAFHYTNLPHNSVIICEVIEALGDNWDFLTLFTDFRTDTVEAGATSSGPIGNSVTGLGLSGANPDIYCSSGELEVVQDYVAIDTPIAAPSGGRDSGAWTDYDGQVALMAHELGHRWMAFGDAEDGNGFVDLTDGPHWQPFLHTPSPGQVQGPMDFSPMGGSFWEDHGNGNFTNRGNNFYYPPKAYSWLGLYLMGLVGPNEVPDFFTIESPSPDTPWAAQHSGVRRDLTIDDFVARNGERLPRASAAQTEFKLGMLGLVLPGQRPGQMLLERMNGISDAFETHWDAATNQLSTIDTVACAAQAETTKVARRAGLTCPPAVTINAGFNDAWYNPLTPGQGFFITAFPVLGQMFLAAFTFDAESPDPGPKAIFGAADQRWLTAFGDFSGNTALLEVEVTSGGLFNAIAPIPGQVPGGTLTVEFADCRFGTIRYNFPDSGLTGIIPIQRLAEDNVALCEALSEP
jgi:hypothetical protein